MSITSPIEAAAFRGTQHAAAGKRRGVPAASRPAPRPIGLLGVPFDNVTLAEAVARIGQMIGSGGVHHVVTANVDFLVQAQRDVELRRILLEADLVLCDGTPLLWASRFLGNPLPERAAGSDVVPLLIRAAAENGHRIFLLGAGSGVAAEAAERLQGQHPALVIAGHYSPPYRELLDMDFPEIARRVKDSRPDVLLVSFGCPKQEKWIAMHLRRLGVPVVMGVGATLDFIAGRMRRAPVLMQRTGTEFVYRLAQEPRRLAGRYFRDLIRFAPSIAFQLWGLCSAGRRPCTAESGPLPEAPDWRLVRVAGDFSAAALNDKRGFFDEAIGALEHCLLDLSQVRLLDSTGVAVLARWRKRLSAHGKRLVLHNPSADVRRSLKLMRLTGHFSTVGPSSEAPHHPGDSTGACREVIPPFPGGHTVAWRGEVTAANAEAVWDLTRGHLASADARQRQTFIIDLTRLRFIDSAGAELMERLRDWAHDLGKGIRFLGSSHDVRNVLRFAGLLDLLEEPRR